MGMFEYNDKLEENSDIGKFFNRESKAGYSFTKRTM